MIGIVFDFNRTLYDPDTAGLCAGAWQLLQRLKEKGHFLFIVGKGGTERDELITRLGIRSFFKEVNLVPEKSLDDFESLKERYPEIKHFYSIGDRTKKDIKYSNQAGFKTIWYQQGKFADEQPADDDEKPWKTIRDLKTVDELIHSDPQ